MERYLDIRENFIQLKLQIVLRKYKRKYKNYVNLDFASSATKEA